MSNIIKASKFICAIFVIIATLQLSTHILLLCFSEQVMGINQATLKFSFFSGHISHKITNSWQNLSQALESEGFNSLAILGTIELLPYFLIYFFLFKLFRLYQQGQIFTVANIACLKNIGKTLLAWIALNTFYPVVVTLFIRLSGLSDSLSIYMSIGSTELFYLLSGLVIYVNAWIMTIAIELKQEQELVI